MTSTTTSPPSRCSLQYAGPKVRAACEACHQRKIRCQMLADGNVCQACDVGGRKCFFIPRAKAGRPRLSRNHPSNHGILRSDPSLRSDDCEIWPDRNNKDQTALIDFSRDFDWTELSNLESTNFFNEGYSPITTEAHNSHPSYCSEQSDASVDTSSSSIALFETANTKSLESYISSPILHGCTTSAEFATVLYTCTGLQNMHQGIVALGIRDSHLASLSNARLQSILQGLDAAGEAIVNAVTNMSNGPRETNSHVSALVTLVVATLLKMLEICGLLVQTSTYDIQTLSQVQLLKRVDFNIMQTRTALQRLANSHISLVSVTMEISSLALGLHKKIKVGLEGLPAELGGIL